MKRIHRTVALVAIGLLASALAAGPALAQSASTTPSSAATSASSQPVVFSWGTDSDIDSLNPYKLCCGPDYIYLEAVYDVAISYGDDLSAAPNIVTSWTPNADSTEWTLKIRNDATFNDGTPVTADDVAFSFSLIADNQMPLYKNYLPFNPTFTVIDDSTILWKADKPTFAPLVPAYIPVVPKHVWEQFVVPGDADATRKAVRGYANENPIGSGPFTLAEYQKGQLLRFVIRPDYWEGPPKSVQELDIRVYQNQEAMVSALKAGEIDFIDSMKGTLWNSPAIQSDPNIATHQANGGCWGNLAWNFGGQGPEANPAPIIHNTEFRQAMSMAINRQEIVDKVYNGTATVGHSVLMPAKNGRWYHDIPENLRFDYNPDQAKAVLDSIGVVDTNGDGIREDPTTHENLDLNLLTITDVDGSVETGKLIGGYFDAVGVGSHFTTVDTNKAYDLWYSGDWDAYVWDWCPDPDPDFMMSVFTTDECLSWSDGCYSNKEYDKLYALQRTQVNFDERQQTIDKMQEMLAEEIPTMVLNYWSNLQAYRTDRFTGYIPSPNIPDGNLVLGWNNDSLWNLTLVSGASSGSTAKGIPPWVWIAVIVVIVVAFGLLAASRRKKEDDEVA